ncbi:MAG: ATP-grasp domain-containing protein [Candidatus Thorarchaeota archaeon]
MTQHSSILKGKKVGVIGFNARPIGASLRRQSAATYVSDYWGDSDLAEVSTDCIAVLSPQPGIRQRQPLDLPLYQSLIENFSVLTKDVDLDYVIIGSGFDDHSDALNPFHEQGLLVGTPPNQMNKSRDFSLLSKLVSDKSCILPKRRIYETVVELLENSSSLKFPCILRPAHSGGGSGVRLLRSHEDLTRITTAQLDESYSYVVQEYIRGRDLSCSILSTSKEATAVSIQRQLIGLPSAGRNCDFVYCGNSIPVSLDPLVEQKILEISEYLSIKLGLKGSNGFDFVIDESDAIWLMEINPRIQGTLEMLEIAGNISITEQHVRSSEGHLIKKRPTFEPTVKMIVYSRKTGLVPNLSLYSDTFDRSPEGIQVNLGDPICTVIKPGRDILDCYTKTCETANAIQRDVKPLK